MNSTLLVLPELPFPGPSSSFGNETLLDNPRAADEAGNVLNSADFVLVQQLSQALGISKSTSDQL